jgi:hypothetical protein
MTAIVDNLIAFKVLHKLVTPFIDTDAYKYGIIDAHGNVLRKSNTLTTAAEKDAYTYLDRLVFNLKKIIAKLPAGSSHLQNMTAALFLVKEYQENKIRTTSLMEARLRKILEHMNNGIVLVEEEILVSKYMQLSEDGGGAGGAGGAGAGGGVASAVPANVTGDRVSTNTPKLLNTKIKKYKEINRRSAPVELRN